MQPRVLGLGLLLVVGCAHSSDAHETQDVDASTTDIKIEIPIQMVDCNDVLLGVVGAKRAALGTHVTWQASANGPRQAFAGVDADDDAGATSPALLWSADDLDLTVTGSNTADIVCSKLGSHNVSVELAPPVPCPAKLDLAIECVALDKKPSDS